MRERRGGGGERQHTPERDPERQWKVGMESLSIVGHLMLFLDDIRGWNTPLVPILVPHPPPVLVPIQLTQKLQNLTCGADTQLALALLIHSSKTRITYTTNDHHKKAMLTEL